MKNKIYCLASLGAFLLPACKKEKSIKTQTDTDGVVTVQPYIWKTLLHRNGEFPLGSIYYSIQYNDNVLVPTTNGENNNYLSMLNTKTGEFLWHWDDRFAPKVNEGAYISNHVQSGNKFIYMSGSRRYCINLDNGTTMWKFKDNMGFKSTVAFMNDNYYALGDVLTKEPDVYGYKIFKGDASTGSVNPYYSPNFSFEHIAGPRSGDVTYLMPYTYNGQPHLAVIWQEVMDSVSQSWQSYLGLFNCVTNTWVYEKSVMCDPNVNGINFSKPVIYNGKIYTDIGKELVCHELATGKRIWKKAFQQDFMFSGITMAGDKLIGNCEDRYTYCLNPETGDVLWATFGTGTAGKISYLNGVVYFGGGSTTFLHAVDVQTGKTVWKIDAKKLGEDEKDGGFWPTGINVIPAKDGEPAKVIALTHRNAYCFKAYR